PGSTTSTAGWARRSWRTAGSSSGRPSTGTWSLSVRRSRTGGPPRSTWTSSCPTRASSGNRWQRLGDDLETPVDDPHDRAHDAHPAEAAVALQERLGRLLDRHHLEHPTGGEDHREVIVGQRLGGADPAPGLHLARLG